jgi:hypothetical protein
VWITRSSVRLRRLTTGSNSGMPERSRGDADLMRLEAAREIARQHMPTAREIRLAS